MWTVALSQLRTQPRRYVSLVLAILIGTLFLAASFLVSSTAQRGDWQRDKRQRRDCENSGDCGHADQGAEPNESRLYSKRTVWPSAGTSTARSA